MKKAVFLFTFFIVFSFLYAQVNKGHFIVDGLRIESPEENEILIEEESYIINDEDLYTCLYKLRNTGKKNTVTFSIKITTGMQEQGCNYTETLIPEDFSISINNKNVDFVYQGSDTVLDSKNVFTKGIYEHDISGNIIFSFEMKKNEIKTLEIKYSINPIKVHVINFAQTINHDKELRRKVSLVKSNESSYIYMITTEKKDYGELELLKVNSNYFDASIFEVERKNDVLLLDCSNPELENIGLWISDFLGSPFSDYGIYSDSICLWKNKPILFSQEEIPKINLFVLNKKQLWLLRNAFYAIHNYKFQNKELEKFFSHLLDGSHCKYLRQDFDENTFTEMEINNIELIKELEDNTSPVLLSDYL